MRRWIPAPSELSRTCHCVPVCPCVWPFAAPSVIACFTAVPRRPSASTLTSCLTDAPGRIGFGSIVWVTPSANLPKHAVARRPAAASIGMRRYIGRDCGLKDPRRGLEPVSLWGGGQYNPRSGPGSRLRRPRERPGIRTAAPTVEVQEMANEECAHCGVLITEWSTVAKRDNKIFCCPNCANAHVTSERASAETATG